ncbi:MAG TPA: restriction endonuclease [Rhizomicrobium sp.]|jgi:hypothetical protein
MKQEILTCYIVAPASAKLATLQKVLRRHDIHVLAPEFDAGSNWQASSALRQADLVIGVLSSERRSQWVLFELGIASALNKRLLLFAPPKTELPSILQRVQVLRTALNNEQAIDFAISQLKVIPSSNIQRDESPVRQSSAYPNIDDWFAELRTVSVRGKERELETFVAGILRKSGVEVVSESPETSARADLAVWSDAFQPSIGNPLLIEIKRALPDKQNARDAIQRFSKVVAASGAYWGLLLFAEEPASSAAWLSMPSNVLSISIPELLSHMRHRPFEAIVRDLRNRRVHGDIF